MVDVLEASIDVPLVAGGGGQVGAALHVCVQAVLFRVGLTMVEVVEVGDDDRHGQSNSENSRNGAQRTNQLTPRTHRPHVTVTHCGHGHHGPPKSVRNACELCILVVRLGEKDGARK